MYKLSAKCSKAKKPIIISKTITKLIFSQVQKKPNLAYQIYQTLQIY